MEDISLINNTTIALIPFYGVNDNTLLKACIQLNLHNSFCKFPNGINDVITYMHTELEKFIAFNFHNTNNITNFKTHEKIKHCINLCLLYYETLPNFRELIKSILRFFSVPKNTCFATQCIFKISNNIWYISGDLSTDFNYYTKRLTLSAIYISTLVYFTNDLSENHTKTLSFLDKHINNILAFHKFKSCIKNIFYTDNNIFHVKF
ncbi:COQ9 family protein [Candidatus Neoehrlichia procyonis]|uniref:COQ9 family protein n=1 Tax=Candidatus Neoehrlichia procyonis str. RAC413 TaxID=1359163 RepID=A0A0F3NNE8_9RICK|nr:COQ9 family protein [Candidatus Neoehrlichia lotoris]KJV69553.1 COQ9 family protein [Candidatus Neoehrlichia lotoris str. RAC413]